jgi:hypothetical protein
MPVRPEVVKVLTSMDWEHSDLAGRGLVHQDGRLFTPAETELVLSAGREDLEGALAVWQSVVDQWMATERDAQRLLELCDPHLKGQQAKIRDALPLMSASDRAEAEAIMARLPPPPL